MATKIKFTKKKEGKCLGNTLEGSILDLGDAVGFKSEERTDGQILEITLIHRPDGVPVTQNKKFKDLKQT